MPFHVAVIQFSDETRADGLWELLDGSNTSCVRSEHILRRASLYRSELSVPSWIRNLTVQFDEPLVCRERQVFYLHLTIFVLGIVVCQANIRLLIKTFRLMKYSTT